MQELLHQLVQMLLPKYNTPKSILPAAFESRFLAAIFCTNKSLGWHLVICACSIAIKLVGIALMRE